MRTSILWRGAATVAAAAVIAAAGAGSAAASPAAATITIATASGLAKVSGDTLVAFLGQDRTATISGTVAGAASGDVVTLLAEPFQATGYSATGSPLTLTAATASYSFSAKPAIATSYEVQVSSADGSILVTSAARTVYVTALASITGQRSCSRPVCHIKLHAWVKLPTRTYQAESAKRWYLYSRLILGHGSEPRIPTVLRLNHNATVSAPSQLHSYEFRVTLRYRFWIGRHSYHWRVNFCTRDSEEADGLGLPGSHHCGDKWVSATAYLG